MRWAVCQMREKQVTGNIPWRKIAGALLMVSISATVSGAGRPNDKTRYDGGVRFATDPELPEGPCFFL